MATAAYVFNTAARLGALARVALEPAFVPPGTVLERELATARDDGYAVSVGELEDSLYGASAAVLSEQGRPLAIVSVWGPERRVPKARLAAIGELTVAAAAQIRELLR